MSTIRPHHCCQGLRPRALAQPPPPLTTLTPLSYNQTCAQQVSSSAAFLRGSWRTGETFQTLASPPKTSAHSSGHPSSDPTWRTRHTARDRDGEESSPSWSWPMSLASPPWIPKVSSTRQPKPHKHPSNRCNLVNPVLYNLPWLPMTF